MLISELRIYNLKIPFRRKIRHGLFVRNQTETIVIAVQDDDGIVGFGEGTPRVYVTGELLDESLRAASRMAREVAGKSFTRTAEIKKYLAGYGLTSDAVTFPAAFCALETALLDLWAQKNNIPVWQLFTDHHAQGDLTYSAVIPFMSELGELQKILEIIEKLKFSVVKVKVVDPDSGYTQLKFIRNRLGAQVDIRVDANGSFSAGGAIKFLKRVRNFNLSAIEQPVEKEDLAGLKKVAQNSAIPVIADESMYARKGPLYLVENNICQGINIRLSSCGGLLKSLLLYQQASEKNMTITLGAHVGESAILSLAGRHFAVLCPKHTYLEGSFSDYVLKEDLVDEDISLGPMGRLAVPKKPGLGIYLSEQAVRKWAGFYGSVSSASR